MTTSVESVRPLAAPTVVDARRAALALPGSVLLFGSVARGEGSSGSDVDVVVVVDRLESEQFSASRLEEERELARRASEVSGCPVQVWLVDWSEWWSRSSVWGTVEHEARTQGKWLKRVPPGRAVRWEKRMSARQVRTSAVIAALNNSYRRFRGVVDSMSPNPIELQLVESGDEEAYWNDLRYRLSDINADLHIALEQLLVAVLHLTASRFTREAHELMVLFEALPPVVQEDLLSRLSVADLSWPEQWRSAASYADAVVQSAEESTTRHLGLITTDVADYTTRLATGYAVGVVAYAAAVIDIGNAVVEMIIELSSRDDSPAAHTDELLNAAERVSGIAGWVRNTLGGSRWLYPDGTPPNGWSR